MIALLAAGLGMPAPAWAQVPLPAPSCPAQPVTYAGTDDVVRELRFLREDVRAACLVARDHGDLAHGDAELRLAELKAGPASIVSAIQANGGPETAQTVALSKADAGRADDARLGVMLLAGLYVVGALIAPALRTRWALR